MSYYPCPIAPCCPPVLDNVVIKKINVVGPQGPQGPTGCPGVMGMNGRFFGNYIYWNGQAWTLGNENIAFGCDAGKFNQGTNAVAIGTYAGTSNQGSSSIALGANAATNQQHENTIVINGTGVDLNTSQPNSLYIKPIRNETSTQVLNYNTITGEITTDGLHIANNIGWTCFECGFEAITNTTIYYHKVGRQVIIQILPFGESFIPAPESLLSYEFLPASYIPLHTSSSFIEGVYIFNDNTFHTQFKLEINSTDGTLHLYHCYVDGNRLITNGNFEAGSRIRLDHAVTLTYISV